MDLTQAELLILLACCRESAERHAEWNSQDWDEPLALASGKLAHRLAAEIRSRSA